MIKSKETTNYEELMRNIFKLWDTIDKLSEVKGTELTNQFMTPVKIDTTSNVNKVKEVV